MVSERFGSSILFTDSLSTISEDNKHERKLAFGIGRYCECLRLRSMLQFCGTVSPTLLRVLKVEFSCVETGNIVISVKLLGAVTIFALCPLHCDKPLVDKY